MSTLLSSPSRPATIASEMGIAGGVSSLLTTVAEFIGEIGYVSVLIGQALKAHREAPESFGNMSTVMVEPWIAWPGDLSSL